MQPVSILLNVLWILIGGAWMAFGWLIAAVIMAITIIGLPWARAAFNIAVYTLLPFGSRAVRRDEVTGMSDLGTGPLGVIGNLIWFILAGWWLAIGHVITAILLAGRSASSFAAEIGSMKMNQEINMMTMENCKHIQLKTKKMDQYGKQIH